MPRFLPVMSSAMLIMAGAMLPGTPADGDESDVRRSEDAALTKPIDFSAGAELRDPFCPVSYVPAGHVGKKVQTVAKDEQYQKALAKLRYGGTIKSGRNYYATVNGTMVREGDVVAVMVDDEVFKFRVHAIDMKGVRYKPVD